MNVKITWRGVGIILLGMAGAGIVGAWTGNPMYGFPILLAALAYLAR